MKKLPLIILTALALLFSCSNNDDPGTKAFDMNAEINISPERQINKRWSAYDSTKTYEDTIKAIFKIDRFYLRWRVTSEYDNKPYERGIGEQNIDTVNYKFIWKGGDVVLRTSMVYYELEFGSMVIENINIVLVDTRKEAISRALVDTLGYIPNSVVYEAREKIVEAFNRQDYDECYRLFDNAYKFRPITGEAYRKLREQGLN